jgi:hypothetical protein
MIDPPGRKHRHGGSHEGRSDRPPHAFHTESFRFIGVPPQMVFTLLDDHQRLSAHMSKSSWMMAGSSMTISTDEAHGQAVGSRIRLSGRVLGVELKVDEVVTERDAEAHFS